MNSIRQDKDQSRRVHEAILNDEQYQGLLKKKLDIYNSVGMQAVIIGEKTRISVNRNAEPLLRQINELIDQRIEQIIRVNTR